MKALLIRDILYLRSQWRRLLSVPAAWLAAMALLPAHRGLLAAAAALFAALLPLCTLDACPGFERYAALLPVSRSALAVSRHVLGALSSAAALAAVLASALLLGWPPWVVYRPALIGLYLGCTLLSLALPPGLRVVRRVNAGVRRGAVALAASGAGRRLARLDEKPRGGVDRRLGRPRLHVRQRHHKRAHLRRTRVLNTKKAVPAGTASACRKSLAEFRALWARKGLQSFSAAACTSPKILLAERASNWPPLAVNRGAERSAGPHRPLMDPTKCRMHFVGEEEQRND